MNYHGSSSFEMNLMCDKKGNPKTRKPESGIGNQKPESGIRNPESGIRNPQIQENMSFKFAKIILHRFCLQKNKRPSKNRSNVPFFETTTSHLLKFVQLLFLVRAMVMKI